MLYDPIGNRKYLTADERRRFIEAARRQPAHIETFCLAMACSGARISEVLSLRVGSIDQSAGIIVIESLKKRRRGIYRQVPVPPRLLQRLREAHHLDSANVSRRLWTWSRTTAWKTIKSVMLEAQVPAYCSTPKALRHAFGVVGVAEAGVPLNMMQKWLGHARIETTAIYANAVGPEERAIASRMWDRDLV
jgi:integrase